MPSTGHQNYLDKSLESYLDIYLITRRNTEVIELFVLIKRLTQKESNYLLKFSAREVMVLVIPLKYFVYYRKYNLKAGLF